MDKTAEQYEADAAANLRAREESWERSDTDGFMSQWASGLMASLNHAKASIARDGGRARFRALFDLDGNLVAAKAGWSQYGFYFGILESDDPRSRFAKFFSPSKASTPARRYAANAKKGYRLGWVMAPADAELAGKSTTSVGVHYFRTDGGFSRDVEVISVDTPQDTDED